MILNCLAMGFKQTLQQRRLVILFYVINLVAGLVIALPLRSMLSDFAGNSLMSTVIAGGFNADFFFELLSNNAAGIKLLTGLIFVVALLFWMIGLFLSGGALSMLLSEEGYKGGLFWSNSAKYFSRFFKLWLLTIPLFIVLYCTQFVETLIVWTFYGSDPYQNIAFWGGMIRVGLGYLSIILYYIIFDYARIYIVKNDEQSILRALRQSLLFTYRTIGRTFVLSTSIFIIGLVLLALSQIVTRPFSGQGTLIIVLLIVGQQIFIFLKTGMKIVLYSAQINLYSRVMPVVSVPVPPAIETLPEHTAPTPDMPV